MKLPKTSPSCDAPLPGHLLWSLHDYAIEHFLAAGKDSLTGLSDVVILHTYNTCDSGNMVQGDRANSNKQISCHSSTGTLPCKGWFASLL